MSHSVSFALNVSFRKRKIAFHGNVDVKFFMFPDFLFSLVMSSKGLNETGINVAFYFIFFFILFSFRACPSPMSLLTTSKTVVFCLSFMPRFPRLTEIWMLGIRIVPAFEEILSAATTCWRVVVL